MKSKNSVKYKKQLYFEKGEDAWVLGSNKCSISVSREDGSFSKFILKKGRKEIDIWREQKGGISIYDELTKREFSDFSSGIDSIESTIDRKSGKDITLSIKKKYRGAAFVVTQQIVIQADHIRFNVQIHKLGGKDRSIQLRFIFPFPMLPSQYLSEQYNQDEGFYPWMLWAPTLEAPFRKGYQDDIRRQDFIYNLGAGRGGITVPIVSAYIPDESVDIGYSLISPLEVYKPKLIFEIEREFGEEFYLPQEGKIRMAIYHLGLRKNRDASSSVILVPHEGDWRPGLGWLYRNYREYFTPTNKKIYQQEGVMLYALPCFPEVKIKEWKKKMGLRWQEIRYEERFGDYVPEDEPWDENAWKTKEHPERELKGLTYEKINDYLEMLNRNEVFGFAYFQVGGDIERNFCRKKTFEEFVIRRKDSSLFPGCTYPDKIRKSWLINPLSNSRWERYILNQAKGIFDKYPLIVGLMVDQLCYRFFDYSRDDGVTMVNNRPVYNNHLSYVRILKKLHSILKTKGKTTFGNGPTTIEVQRYIDGIIAEGRLDFLGSQAYVALAKPLLMYDPKISGLKWCLKYGAFPSVLPALDRWPNKRKCIPRYVEAYKTYLPLFELMRGRAWVLTPHALRLPEGIDGNIFKTKRNDYIITIIPKEIDLDSSEDVIKTRLTDAARINKIYLMGINTKRRQQMAFSRNGKDISINLPQKTGVGILLLKSSE